MLIRILQNHVLANIMFVLVMVMGVSSYALLPREQDPSINFNWINIITVLPGAATPDVEKQVTDVLEDAIRNVDDIKFISSTSREGISTILVRFEDVSTRIFDKRVADLRREVDGVEGTLPSNASNPYIFEITTANAFPAATVAISAAADDENLRRQATLVKQDIEQLKGVGRVLANGLSAPEIHVAFDPARLQHYGLNAVDLADTVRAYYREVAAGTITIAQSSWAVKLSGNQYDLEQLSNLPILTAEGEVPLHQVAEIFQGKEPGLGLVRLNGRPAVLLMINKQEKQNLLKLVARICDFIDRRQPAYAKSGVTVTLVDDQTQITRTALRVMQTNALIGLIMVFAITGLFLGLPIALLTGIAIPFILAGTFWFLSTIGQTLNVTVLLGIVISLGMLVDDAVVVVEAIYYRLQRGAATLAAVVDGLMEVIGPVTTAVLTTIAAFLPLMLLPGILGKFMQVIPIVVTCALVISLIEAYWLLPAHVIVMRVDFTKPSRLHTLRERWQRGLRQYYTRGLVRVLRHPGRAVGVLMFIFASTIGILQFGNIKYDFFASDPIRLFYVNVQMPAGTEINTTLDKVLEIETIVKHHVTDDEVRAMVSYAGELQTKLEPLFGDQYGQILISLHPEAEQSRSVNAIIDSMQAAVLAIPGTEQTSFLRLASGPPVTRDISLKVRGDDLAELIAATDALKAWMAARAEFTDVEDNNLPGQNTLQLQLDSAAIQRTGIRPEVVRQTLSLLVDGQIVSDFRHLGEKVSIRVQSSQKINEIDQLLEFQLPTNDDTLIPLRQLVTPTYTHSPVSILHYNYRRNITVEADINAAITDIVQANMLIRQYWQTIQSQYPTIDLDFSGVLDDIEESLSAIGLLFLLGLGLIYLILGTQFKSYFQPFLIILTVPMAATGVIFGLVISRYPLSLYTIYGIVALAGIAVNAAIVLISAANVRQQAGMAVAHAIVYAARRRVIPIIITSLTTIAGLFSLATGLGGHSLLWGPVASSMVWGLAVSTLLTLFYIPLLYNLCMRPWSLRAVLQASGAWLRRAPNDWHRVGLRGARWLATRPWRRAVPAVRRGLAARPWRVAYVRVQRLYATRAWRPYIRQTRRQTRAAVIRYGRAWWRRRPLAWITIGSKSAKIARNIGPGVAQAGTRIYAWSYAITRAVARRTPPRHASPPLTTHDRRMKILIADSFPPTHAEQLTRAGHQLTIEPSLDGDTLPAAMADHELLIVRSTQVTAATLDAARALKLVIRAGAGTNTINKVHAAQLAIRVCNVPGANALAVAELVLGLILAIDRNIPDNVAELRQQTWNKKKYAQARGLCGQKLGILGLGAIGLAVAERARAFGMAVHAVAKTGRSDAAQQRISAAGIIQVQSLAELLSDCDMVSLHLPATTETHHLVDADFLERMKDGAVLINTARGELIDEAALIAAMDARGLRAGLDVYADEPATAQGTFASALARHPNVYGTHHIGASTAQAQVAVADGVLTVIQSYLDKNLVHCVNN